MSLVFLAYFSLLLASIRLTGKINAAMVTYLPQIILFHPKNDLLRHGKTNGGGDSVKQQNSNDSLEQKREKKYNQEIKSDPRSESKRTDGPIHPST
ncbi:hypothetical protein AXX12_18015 [Anaerosporomusa subterranea]|uniref:Uncharacterized protein n=1 Tax=Anaerosporomusa subterranea TaxID=1794912 RepID=A0A154BUQ8_ANASB|nr:hypothetical protein AXX12_18015 [Anaerosporomusa subterranea]